MFGWDFEVIPAYIDESRLIEESPKDYVRRLAIQKAAEITRQVEGLVIAADTIVVDGEVLLGKPADEGEARCMLGQLRGHVHQVYSGIAIADTESGAAYDAICCTDVPMRHYSDAEIEAYIETGDPMDKAGAYAIQHSGFHPVDALNGCFASVMGLPLCHLILGFKRLGLIVPDDLPYRCQGYLNYDCPVFEKLLESE